MVRAKTPAGKSFPFLKVGLAACVGIMAILVPTAAAQGPAVPGQNEDILGGIGARTLWAWMAPPRIAPGQIPLAVVDVPEAWIAELAEQTFDERMPVDLTVLGTRVRGTSQTSGRYTAESLDGKGGLAVVIRVQGKSVATTCGRKGPAVIRTVSTTVFSATKVVYLLDRTLVTLPTSVDATSLSRNSQVTSQIRLGRRLVRRIAHRRIQRNRETIDAIAERYAERRIVAAVDREVEKFRLRVSGRLDEIRTMLPWLSWGNDRKLVHLRTINRALRFSVQDGGGRMIDPLFFGWTESGSRWHVWLDRRTLEALSDGIRQRFRRLVASAAVIADRFGERWLPESTPPPRWSIRLLWSPMAVEVRELSAGGTVRIPLLADPATEFLKGVGLLPDGDALGPAPVP